MLQGWHVQAEVAASKKRHVRFANASQSQRSIFATVAWQQGWSKSSLNAAAKCLFVLGPLRMWPEMYFVMPHMDSEFGRAVQVLRLRSVGGHPAVGAHHPRFYDWNTKQGLQQRNLLSTAPPRTNLVAMAK